MDGLFWLREEQLEKIKPFFPKSRGVSRVDDRKVLSGIIYTHCHQSAGPDSTEDGPVQSPSKGDMQIPACQGKGCQPNRSYGGKGGFPITP